MTRILDVWLHETNAGQLTQEQDGSLGFSYSPQYLAGERRAAISVSMPLREESYPDRVARPFFSGLLPDDRARRKLASALGISEGNTFGLLEVIGGECAGALSLLPEGDSFPDAASHPPEPLSKKRLVDLLDLLHSRPLLGGEHGVRLSLAGAQDKLAVCQVDGQIALAKVGHPTTHIVKPAIDGLQGTVENEIFCMRLAQRMGFSTPTVVKGTAGKTSYYLIERYDRHIDGDGVVTRLHQEDFCQALSVPPELKYEEEGGPGIIAAQGLIAQHTRRPAADRLAFLRSVMYQYLIGNADAHAKNYALLYRDTTPDLAPLYDLICTGAYPSLSGKMAMQIGGRALADTIHLTHWLSLVPDTRAAQRLLCKDLKEMSAAIINQSGDLLEQLRDEDIYHPVLKKVLDIIHKRSRQLRKIVPD